MPATSENRDRPDLMRFSIVTPSFRQLDHLKRCVVSVADQAGSFEVEHLIHDGGSGPDFEEWASNQRHASVVIEKDKGMYDAINRGLRRSSGEIVAWLNCDEQYLAGTLAKVSDWFDAHPGIDILFGDVVIVSLEGMPISYRKALAPLPGHIKNCFLPTYSAATFVRRRIIEEGNMLDADRIAIADAIWIHGLLKKGYRCGTLGSPLSVFMQTGENLGQSPRGREESEAWRGNRRFRRALWGACHRIRKFAAGCYVKKSVRIGLYLGEHPERRMREAIVGEVWKAS